MTSTETYRPVATLTGAEKVDRAAAVRRALRSLVAEHGFHGSSMSAVAKRAGVGTGTAYVHYESKEALVFATYLEVKRELGTAAMSDVDPSASFHERFLKMWFGIYRHLQLEPERARFLVQVDSSPFARPAHQLAMSAYDDPIMAEATPETLALLAPLPLDIIYELGLAPAIRLAASGIELDETTLGLIANACWRAMTTA